jgi:hypothetical protein
LKRGRLTDLKNLKEALELTIKSRTPEKKIKKAF